MNRALLLDLLYLRLVNALCEPKCVFIPCLFRFTQDVGDQRL